MASNWAPVMVVVVAMQNVLSIMTQVRSRRSTLVHRDTHRRGRDAVRHNFEGSRNAIFRQTGMRAGARNLAADRSRPAGYIPGTRQSLRDGSARFAILGRPATLPW